MAEHSIRGKLSRTELADLIERGEIETVVTAFPDMYGRLLGKRITGHFFLDHVADEGMHVCDYLLACDMEMDPVPGYHFTSWEKGYGDMHCVVDWNTLRRAAWLDRTAIVLCDLHNNQTGTPLEVAPRRMLQRQIERARKMGLIAKGGSEIELFVFKESYESARQKHYHALQPFADYIEDYHIFQGTKEEPLIGAIVRGLDNSGIPIEFSKGEWGPGQQEINLTYCDVLEQADRNVLYKHAAHEIAHQQNLAVTFMAKWDERMAGSSMHLHISLWDAATDSSVFPGVSKLGPVECSDIFRWFLGGWMAHAAPFAACYAPNVNSYKRYQAGSFAPTGIAWSYDNRTAGFRVVGRGSSLRVECRIPGADANPYIAYAAALAAGLDGVENRIEPPPIFDGDVYAAGSLPRIPGTLHEAITHFEDSHLARIAFGEDVVDHYLHFLKTEQRKFDEIVTSWERARYFERI